MNNIYHWIGFAFVWLSVFTVGFYVLSLFYTIILNWIGKRFKSIWIIYEFQFYKKDFKEWIKVKQRHKNMQ